MVKAYWIAVALVAGIVIGLFIGRPGAHTPQSPDDPAARTAAAAQPPPPPGGRPETAATASRPPAPAAPPSRPPDLRMAGNTAADPAGAPGAFEKSGGALVATEVNGAPLGRAENLQTMHERFLREERDDSWAYLHETEFENSVVTEVSSGKFRKDRIECRATMCELEFSAKGEQVEQLSKWYEALNHNIPRPENGQLQMRMGSFNGEDGGATVKLLYVKPEQLLPPPKPD